jgi:hypothetical protein
MGVKVNPRLLHAGLEYKDEVLEEWRKRERERRSSWDALVRRAQFDVRKAAAATFEAVRQYVQGEFGKPTLRDKEDFVISASLGHLKECKSYLLKFIEVEGAINCQAELDGRTALHVAAERGDDELVAFLLHNKADVSVSDRLGLTPLHYAAASDSLECLEMLLQVGLKTGQDPDVRCRAGTTPLMRAAGAGDPDAVDLLLEFAAVPSIRDSGERWTALHYAAQSGDVESIKSLLRAGCDYRKQATDQRTALNVAIDMGHKEAAVLLIKWRKFKLIPPKPGRFSLENINDMDLFEAAP